MTEQAQLLTVFADYEARFSRFLPKSELCAVNARAGSYIQVSATFAHVLRLALQAVATSGGLVDPTLGGALEAAGYDLDFPALANPELASCPTGRPQPSRLTELRLQSRLLFLPAGVALDLNGVVKSLAVDEALAACPGASYIAAGGDLAVRASTVVGLPGGDSVTLVSGGLATSGQAKRRWQRGGTEQHHLIDPASGAPARSPWASVSVCGATCLDADIAAKTAFLLAERGPAWLDERGLPGRFLALDGVVLENVAWREAVGA